MDLKLLVDSFNIDELNLISSYIHERRKTLIVTRSLTPEMREEVYNGNWITAIKLYRSYYNTSLFEAKTAIDKFRGI